MCMCHDSHSSKPTACLKGSVLKTMAVAAVQCYGQILKGINSKPIVEIFHHFFDIVEIYQ